MKFKLIIFIVFLIVIVSFLVFWYWPKSAYPVVTDFDSCLQAGYPIMESYPRQCQNPDGRKFIEDIGNELEKADLIRITNPRPNQTITSPLTITGEARGNWFFEASFPIKLLDENGQQIAIAVAQAKGEWLTTEFVPFEATLEFSAQNSRKGKLVLEKDNPSGLPENDDQLIMPVVFNQSHELMTVKVYFNTPKSAQVPDFDCQYVEAVERKIPKTLGIAKVALKELLKGPTESEKAAGFYTSINSDVKIQKIEIYQETAYIDFNSQLEYQVGGSCRVAAIRSQIVQTLKQFSTVKNVVISVDSRTEDVLQP
ncbi:MAG: hypothetical protein A2729_03785 [Candidatus Buchananbacteria bacterium RIFCSPHIGHO2_01_FULL_39_14]|uniref:GerMN domain-containing protein n=2 Tax=Candidatus Buchananiibacteriota TaxID=1817903 RepID=A0A1G1YPG1_9BACT|nr:MAG: hypothetical protein A2729_03785 [Candidatus Buchananbacteria bacterium RIFCSPHIGHO2_01_FULL_39_14]OGY48498.1 MAG: hypothetical protein A3D39_04965 [Candidatus Buchananbacteria bacterium RIFCSPHIGHO2_02_FULL_39_17]OGY54253.1 MAG: hypothetical protein A2912_04395 [Candidatus Buchananbacteria bacterium RIFCSPLOWO2_01_FULL_40_23b]